jgi:hypothetical protein
MAQFTRVNGDFLPVAVYDNGTGNAYVNSGNVNAVTSAATVQPQGPALTFFTAAGNGSTLTTYTTAVFAAVEQLNTVMIYEANTAPTDDTIAFAVYPVGANTTAIGTAITAALDQQGAANNAVSITTVATFTN